VLEQRDVGHEHAHACCVSQNTHTSRKTDDFNFALFHIYWNIKGVTVKRLGRIIAKIKWCSFLPTDSRQSRKWSTVQYNSSPANQVSHIIHAEWKQLFIQCPSPIHNIASWILRQYERATLKTKSVYAVFSQNNRQHVIAAVVRTWCNEYPSVQIWIQIRIFNFKNAKSPILCGGGVFHCCTSCRREINYQL